MPASWRFECYGGIIIVARKMLPIMSLSKVVCSGIYDVNFYGLESTENIVVTVDVWGYNSWIKYTTLKQCIGAAESRNYYFNKHTNKF